MKVKIFFIATLFNLNSFTQINKKQIAAVKITKNISTRIGKNVLKFTNKFRANHSLNPLSWNQDLANIAWQRANLLATNKLPFTPEHRGFAQAIGNMKSGPKIAAENLYKTNSSEYLAWFTVFHLKKSPNHRKNMLRNLNAAGIGAAKNKQGIWFVVQILGLY